MAHSIKKVWFDKPVPHPNPRHSDELRSYLVVKPKGDERPSSVESILVDSIELHGPFVTVTSGNSSRSIPIQNVITFEPPPPKRGRPPKETAK